VAPETAAITQAQPSGRLRPARPLAPALRGPSGEAALRPASAAAATMEKPALGAEDLRFELVVSFEAARTLVGACRVPRVAGNTCGE
jgi:hypothetical protein